MAGGRTPTNRCPDPAAVRSYLTEFSDFGVGRLFPASTDRLGARRGGEKRDNSPAARQFASPRPGCDTDVAGSCSMPDRRWS